MNVVTNIKRFMNTNLTVLDEASEHLPHLNAPLIDHFSFHFSANKSHPSQYAPRC